MRLAPLELRDGDRTVLESWTRAGTVEARTAKRARIVLLAAAGMTNRNIAALVDLHYNQVGMWRTRYAEFGLAGLEDEERPGRPCVYDHDDVLLLVKTVTEPPPDGATRWTMEALAEAMAAHGVPISASQAWRICKALDLKPWQVESPPSAAELDCLPRRARLNSSDHRAPHYARLPVTRRRPRAAALLALLVLVAGLVAADVARPRPAGAFPKPTLDLLGHGFGHGRGMGQYGALGYAVDHGFNYKQILGHFYGGTTEGNIGNPEMTVRFVRLDNQHTIVQQERGLMTTTAAAGNYSALRARVVAPNLFEVDSASDCTGGAAGWQRITSAPVPGPIAFVPVRRDEDRQNMLQVCDPSGTRWYRGQIEAHHDGGQRTLNRLDMENYLRGVVPRESPASWGDLGGGAGLHALRAQAVAARSYAQAEERPGPSKTCDTESCQVYGGRAMSDNAGFRDLEDPRTDRAIAETAGEVRLLNGVPARTEFSSSTGGISAGGTFPAVVDEGDDVASNPNHNWTASIPVGAIEAKYARGTLNDIQILQRNRLGAEGGRVLRMRLAFSGGSLDLTGDDFRRDMGLKSNWFTPTNVASFPYHVLTRDGGVFSFGGAEFHGSLPGVGVRTAARDITEGPGGGYWVLGEDGGVFSFGVEFYGSMGGQRLNSPVVGMEGTATRRGYWLVAGDGGIFSFGDAQFFGSTGSMRLNAPVVGMAPTPTAGGYWLVATDGGVFTFGDASFLGSTGNIRLNQPMFAMAATPTGQGYWLVARDGGIFTFGDATFQGSLPGRGIAETAVELLPSPSGLGYLIVTAQGRVHAFGDASSEGGPRDVGAGPSPAVGAGRALP